MVRIHPQTRQRFVAAKHSGDIMLDAAGPAALSQEKVPVIGGWKDYTGSGGVPTKQQTMMPTPNTLWGTDAWLDGAKNYDRNVLGDRTKNIRLRRKKILVDLKDSVSIG